MFETRICGLLQGHQWAAKSFAGLGSTLECIGLDIDMSSPLAAIIPLPSNNSNGTTSQDPVSKITILMIRPLESFVMVVWFSQHG